MSENDGENSHEETEIDTHTLIEVDTVNGKRIVHEKEEIKKKTKIDKSSDKISTEEIKNDSDKVSTRDSERINEKKGDEKRPLFAASRSSIPF